uniref:Uncharacterized protein n=1 Tax=Musa acuminata subsp. malaccensis TaxID=214687 RepID=A0A804JNY3_MUSAM
MKMEYEERYRQIQSPKYDCLLFDLDDTLYPLSSGIAAECRRNIGDYLVEKLGIEESKISDLCNLLYKNYGTTMAGLRVIRERKLLFFFAYVSWQTLFLCLCRRFPCVAQAIGYSFDYDDYHRFVHGRLPYENLKADPVLGPLLLSLPLRKVVFTNADKAHAAKVLKKLGLEDCFEGIICFETLNPPTSSRGTETSSEVFDIVDHFARPVAGVALPRTPVLCKPSPDAMERALSIANIDPHRTVFFDDSVRNIQAGKRIGLHTVLVGTRHRVKGADHALESIHNMREALPELWEEAEKSDSIRYSGKVAMETSVTA